jgi:hypothetical protein
MKMPPGAEDQPHDHPAHSMYFVTQARLQIVLFAKDGRPAGDTSVVDIPAGAPPIFPPGAHQIKNVGTTEARTIFVEPYPMCLSRIADFKDEFTTAFKASPNCYRILAENDDWVTGMVTLEAGEQDRLHDHRE